jgi:hypothetical protein
MILYLCKCLFFSRDFFCRVFCLFSVFHSLGQVQFLYSLGVTLQTVLLFGYGSVQFVHLELALCVMATSMVAVAGLCS